MSRTITLVSVASILLAITIGLIWIGVSNTRVRELVVEIDYHAH
jgi:hypothetical protein